MALHLSVVLLIRNSELNRVRKCLTSPRSYLSLNFQALLAFYVETGTLTSWEQEQGGKKPPAADFLPVLLCDA